MQRHGAMLDSCDVCLQDSETPSDNAYYYRTVHTFSAKVLDGTQFTPGNLRFLGLLNFEIAVF
jgi:hypothetical protein